MNKLSSLNLNFRLYLSKDYSKLRKMIFGLYHEDHLGEKITLQKINLTIKNIFSQCKGKIIIFESKRQVIGYSILILFWSNEFGGNFISIDEIYVKPNFRNRKIATTFINKIDQFFKKVVGLKLEVTKNNVKAKTIYLRLGFRESKTKEYYKLI